MITTLALDLAAGASAFSQQVAQGTQQVAASAYSLSTSPSSIDFSTSSTTTLTFPEEMPKYFMYLGMSEYKRKDNFNLALVHLDPKAHIRMPLPTQITDNHSVEYEAKSVSQILGSISTMGLSPGTAAAAVTTLAGFGTSLLGSAAGLATVLGGSKAGAAVAAVGAAGDSVFNAIRAVTGLAPNPFLTILIKGPEYKKHNFTWRLSPQNATESESIRKIIATLNNAMAPSYDSNLGTAFFKFPKVFDIGFIPNSEMLLRYKPAVLRAMSVNYAPSGVPSFYRETMAPDAVEITVEFLELEYWISGQFGPV